MFEGVDEVSSDGLDEDVKPSRRRVRSAPAPNKIKKEFQPTKIEPFAMSVREEQKLRDKEIMAQMVQVEEVVDGQDGLVQFKAKPVPKHVFKPVFQNMVETQPKR